MDTSRLGLCEVCGHQDAIYTCPKCEVKTCSLPCVKVHKKELECDGIRDKTKFIPLNKFTNLDLQSDYRLMGEVTSSIESQKRDRSRGCTRINKDLPVHLYRLQCAANRRHTVLKYLPANFTKHKNNTTYLDWKSQLLYWRIEWIFPNAENVKYVDERCLETSKIGSLLEKYLNSSANEGLTNKFLQFYQSAGFNGIKILLKAEEKRGKKFYELEPMDILKDVLKHKIVIEHPTVYIILKNHADEYDIVESDDEVENEEIVNGTLQSGSVLAKLANVKSGTDGDNSKKNKNLLFISEYSDLENSSSSDEESSRPPLKIPRRE